MDIRSLPNAVLFCLKDIIERDDLEEDAVGGGKPHSTVQQRCLHMRCSVGCTNLLSCDTSTWVITFIGVCSINSCSVDEAGGSEMRTRSVGCTPRRSSLTFCTQHHDSGTARLPWRLSLGYALYTI
jgi:hypothetical protein